jgi:hypothetical protein
MISFQPAYKTEIRAFANDAIINVQLYPNTDVFTPYDLTGITTATFSIYRGNSTAGELLFTATETSGLTITDNTIVLNADSTLTAFGNNTGANYATLKIGTEAGPLTILTALVSII